MGQAYFAPKVYVHVLNGHVNGELDRGPIVSTALFKNLNNVLSTRNHKIYAGETNRKKLTWMVLKVVSPFAL